MGWQDYKTSQKYKHITIGTLGGRYVLERKMQSGMISDFYLLHKEEYETFMNWCLSYELVSEIYLRKVWMRGFFGHGEFELLNAQ